MVYNIGNNKPVKLMDYIETLERCLGMEAKKEYLPMQPGDVYQTYADVTDMMREYDKAEPGNLRAQPELHPLL